MSDGLKVLRLLMWGWGFQFGNCLVVLISFGKLEPLIGKVGMHSNQSQASRSTSLLLDIRIK